MQGERVLRYVEPLSHPPRGATQEKGSLCRDERWSDSELDQAAARMAEMPFAIYRGDLQADVQLQHHEELVVLFATAFAKDA